MRTHRTALTVTNAPKPGKKYFSVAQANEALPYVERVANDIADRYQQAVEVRRQIEQPHSHQVWTQDMARELDLMPLPSLVATLGHQARVVHQTVQRVHAAGQIRRPGPYRVEVGNVADFFHDLGPGDRGADRASAAAHLGGVAAE